MRVFHFLLRSLLLILYTIGNNSCWWNLFEVLSVYISFWLLCTLSMVSSSLLNRLILWFFEHQHPLRNASCSFSWPIGRSLGILLFLHYEDMHIRTLPINVEILKNSHNSKHVLCMDALTPIDTAYRDGSFLT